MVTCKGGSEVENYGKQLNKLTGVQVHINIVLIKKPDLERKLRTENTSRQLEQRTSFRVRNGQANERTNGRGRKGIKTQASGVLNGRDIRRVEHYNEGLVPHDTYGRDTY